MKLYHLLLTAATFRVGYLSDVLISNVVQSGLQTLLPTLTRDHNVICKHQSLQRLLPDIICQPVHHCCKQEGA